MVAAEGGKAPTSGCESWGVRGDEWPRQEREEHPTVECGEGVGRGNNTFFRLLGPPSTKSEERNEVYSFFFCFSVKCWEKV